MDKKSGNKTTNYFKKEGFYVALFVCLCLVATFAAMSIKGSGGNKQSATVDSTNKPDKTTNSNVTNPSDSTLVDNSKMYPNDRGATTITPTPIATVAPAKDTTVATAAKPVLSFTKPAAGSLLLGFSDLAKIDPTDSKTIQSIETVNGMYINCKIGQDVFAAESGVVVDSDAAINFGTVLTIKHQDGYKTVYGNLSETPTVKTGDKVLRGQKIATIGKTSNHYPSYTVLNTGFLYFQVLKNEISIDPVTCNIKY